MKLKIIGLFFIFYFLSIKSQASFVIANLGPKTETYTEVGQTRRSRSNPLGVSLEWGQRLRPMWYTSVGVSGEFSLDDFSSRGFGVAFQIKRFFMGSPSYTEQKTTRGKISLTEPYGFFIGGGFFNKNVRFKDDQLRDLDLNLGGPAVSFGGNYNWNENFFLTGQFQFMLSGIGSDETYQSYDLYFGIGLRL